MRRPVFSSYPEPSRVRCVRRHAPCCHQCGHGELILAVSTCSLSTLMSTGSMSQPRVLAGRPGNVAGGIGKRSGCNSWGIESAPAAPRMPLCWLDGCPFGIVTFRTDTDLRFAVFERKISLLFFSSSNSAKHFLDFYKKLTRQTF